MLAIWVKVRVKPDQRKRFLEAIEVDALGSERDESGCLRFNVLQDDQDENTYYFFEVYKDQAALEAHRAAPHYAVWRAAADSLDGPTAPTGARCRAPRGTPGSAGPLRPVSTGRRPCQRSITPGRERDRQRCCRIRRFNR